jgi:hypothetical protein
MQRKDAAHILHKVFRNANGRYNNVSFGYHTIMKNKPQQETKQQQKATNKLNNNNKQSDC